MKPFVHLHNHTEFSLLDGAARINDLVAAAVRDDAPGLGITDHGNLYGLPKFFRACRDHDIKPVLGTELYFTDDRYNCEPVSVGSDLDGSSKHYYHLTILARNNTGYHNLIRLSSDAFLEGFFRKPRGDWDSIAQFSDGLVATSGCLGGPVLQALLHDNYDLALSRAVRLQDIFGVDNFYIELQDHGIADQKRTNPQLIDIARAINAPLLASNDVHYTNHTDHKSHDALLCCQTNAKLADAKRFRFASDQHYLKTSEEMRHIFRDVEDACDNTLVLTDGVDVTLDFDSLHFPTVAIPEGFASPGQYLSALAHKGLEKRLRGASGQSVKEAQARLEYELGVVESLGLSPYFLIVWDIVRWADRQEIARGPARGSVAGCYIAYCLNISKVDPLRHGLLFERFLNPDRIAMPDIDLDFSPRGREHVINYIAETYGRDHVAQIITFGVIKARTAVRDAARVLGYQPKLGDIISKLMPELVGGVPTPLWACLEHTEKYSSGYRNSERLRELYASDPEAHEIIDVALGLEDLVRQDGIGAAGVLITPDALTEHVPIQRKPNGPVVTQYDKADCEDLGLLKMDILGLRNIDVIDDTLKFLGGQAPNLESDAFMQFNDFNTLQLLRAGDTVGVFQLESGPMMELLRAVKPNSLDDIAAVIALYRPGPMGTNMHNEYADRKNHRKPIIPLHPDAMDILADTYQLCVFQEQLMKLAQRFAGYTGSEADKLRKIIGKKLVDEVGLERDRFVSGCLSNGYSIELAESLFKIVEDNASYSFNQSHAVGYAYIAYQTAYLKANHPVEYMAALCGSVAHDTEKCATYISVARSMGIEILSPNVNIAQTYFSPLNNSIVIGLDAVKFLGHVAAKELVDERESGGSFISIQDLLRRVPLTVRHVQSLAGAGALDDFGTRLGIHSSANELLTQIRREAKGSASKQVSLFQEVDFWNFQLPSKEFSDYEKLSEEKAALGLYVSGHPLTKIRPTSNHQHTRLSQDFSGSTEMLLTILSVTEKTTRNGQKMAVVMVSDETATKEVLVFPRTWAKVHIEEDQSGVALVKAIEDDVTGSIKLLLEDFTAATYATEPTSPVDIVKLRLPRGFAANDLAVSKLKGILLAHHGSSPVVVQVSAKSELDMKHQYSVEWTDTLRNELAELFRKYSQDKKK